MQSIIDSYALDTGYYSIAGYLYPPWSYAQEYLLPGVNGVHWAVLLISFSSPMSFFFRAKMQERRNRFWQMPTVSMMLASTTFSGFSSWWRLYHLASSYFHTKYDTSLARLCLYLRQWLSLCFYEALERWIGIITWMSSVIETSTVLRPLKHHKSLRYQRLTRNFVVIWKSLTLPGRKPSASTERLSFFNKLLFSG